MNGVYFNKQRQQWHARATIKGKRYHVGYFRTELSGLRALDDYLYKRSHPDTGVLKKYKFEPFKWAAREISRIREK